MFKKLLTIAGAAAALLVGSVVQAADATFTLTTTPVIYAAEIFGDGSDATALEGSGVLTLTVAAGQVDDGATGTLTVTLTNATFGDDLLASDLDFTEGAAEGDQIQIGIDSGGTAGDASVVFSIETQADGDADSEVIEVGDTLTLTIPDLLNASALGTAATSVTVTASFTPVLSSGKNDFANATAAVGDGNGGAIATSADEMTITFNVGTDGSIDIDNRESLLAGDAGTVTVNTVQNAPAAGDDALQVGDLEIDEGEQGADTTRFIADGATNLDTDGNDDVVVVLNAQSGSFNAGDEAFLDLDSDAEHDAGEGLTMVDSTTFSGTFDADDIVTATDPDTGLSGPAELYYVPNSSDDLKPATFNGELTVSFNEATYAELDAETVDATPAAASVDTSYSGLEEDGWALAIPNSTQSDIGNVRITNESDSPADIFAQCYGQDGTDLGFVEILTDIPAQATEVLQADDLETLLGLTGPWDGRAKCDFSVNENVSVQILTRTNGTLVNNSAVSGTNSQANAGGLRANIER